MHPFAQVLLDGIFTGSTYALMAAGLALILGVVKVVNLSHGAFFSLGAYIAYVLSTKGVSHPAAAVLPAALIAFAFGVFLGNRFINPLRSHPLFVRCRWVLPGNLIAEEEEIAESVGMDVEKIRSLTFGFASAAAAVAGALLAPATSITPTLGRGPAIPSPILVIAPGLEE